MNLPLHGFDQNQIWVAIVALAVELTAWWQMLALADHPARRWEPKLLRLQLFSIAGRVADHGRTRRLHLAARSSAPWARLLADRTRPAARTGCTNLTDAPPCPDNQDAPTGPWTRQPPHASGPDFAPLEQNQPSNSGYAVESHDTKERLKDPG